MCVLIGWTDLMDWVTLIGWIDLIDLIDMKQLGRKKRGADRAMFIDAS